jgi:hypothetical protein
VGHDASLMEPSNVMVGTDANLEDNVSQMRSAKTSSEKSSAHAHPISHPWESSEAFARIGLVADGVGPKKPKTSEYQQPRPAVEPLLGVVRGVGGASKARREVGSHIKPVNVGESSVNTHTGSVSVAGSQSNTVTPEAGPGAHKWKDSLKTDASKQAKQETSNKSSSVDRSICVKSSENSVREEAKPIYKKEPAVSTLKERMKTNSKFEINTLPGGKFGLKLARPKPTFMKSSARKYTENEKHTSEFRGGDHNLNTSARKMFRGENNKTFNNIPILNTPTKRKMDFAVVNEVSICPGSPCAILPGQDNSESPAKRRKWGQ